MSDNPTTIQWQTSIMEGDPREWFAHTLLHDHWTYDELKGRVLEMLDHLPVETLRKMRGRDVHNIYLSDTEGMHTSPTREEDL